MRRIFNFLTLGIILSSIFVSCDDEESYNPIQVETKEVVSFDYQSAIVAGKILEFGKGVDAYGHCWSTNLIPSIEDDTTLILNEIGGDFQSNIADLEAGTKYYIRAYALNEDEITYGEILSFTTDVDPLKEGLVAFYPFDGDTYDYSGYENDATNYGATLTTDRFGNENVAYDFDGLTNYMQLSKDINFTDGLTFAFWINSRGAQAGQNNGVVISKYDMLYGNDFYIGSFGYKNDNTNNMIKAIYLPYSTVSSLSDYVTSNWTLGTIPESFNSSLYTFENPTSLSLNEWNFIVVNLTQQELEVWINGTLTVKKERQYTTYANDPEVPICIGNIPSGGEGDNNHFHGKLDDLKVYNRALTEDEILALYYEGGWNQ